ncbi:hypothetical protein HMPREF1420_01249 [Helicobacter pylori GAM264Ai]|nr:hypothetical protein HMPREF1407_01483 [Helicobacter pylori GAM244Ai]EMH23897.1 hypothetical protein HMPREF1420_01249 [Helicobacter pylori GAM264Ai]
MKQAIILTEFNQGLDMQFLNQSLGFLALMPKEVQAMNFYKSNKYLFKVKLGARLLTTPL